MRTRTSIVLLAGTLAACATRVSPSATPLEQPVASGPREMLPDEQVQHVLNRLAFGARPGDVQHVREIGVDRWIAQQLAVESVPDAAGVAVMASYDTFRSSSGDLAALYRDLQSIRRDAQRVKTSITDTNPAARTAQMAARVDIPRLRQVSQRAQKVNLDLQSSRLAMAVASDRQLNEVMVDFWENHFSVFAGKGPVRFYIPEYDRDVIRPRAMGKFRDLLGAVAKSPAMLFYLDNWQSMADTAHPTLTASRQNAQVRARLLASLGDEQRQRAMQAMQKRSGRGLNENYARELMELHTLGVDGGYTQHDVIEVARALTGWTFAPQQAGGFTFRPEMHDAGEKVVLGHRLPAGRGIEDGNDVLDILARAPATAHFVTRKLAARFVSDVPAPALVDRCAARFTSSDGDIRETVRCLVTSPEFFSRSVYRAKVKSPFELVASALRAMNAPPDSTARSAQIVARLGQPIFGRQTPDGWPDRADAWMNTGAILSRINFGLSLAGGRVTGVSMNGWAPAAELRNATREAQVDGVVRALLGGQVSSETRAILVRGENPLLDRGDPDAGMAPAVMRAADRPVQLQGLAQVVGLALGAPEFQRR
ncbi:MAG: hypothetical protein JWO05_173 [Gemmatimonadetes bacterium]|nr:hypothetical protein [Gemmatimonadota bacterium]